MVGTSERRWAACLSSSGVYTCVCVCLDVFSLLAIPSSNSSQKESRDEQTPATSWAECGDRKYGNFQSEEEVEVSPSTDSQGGIDLVDLLLPSFSVHS